MNGTCPKCGEEIEDYEIGETLEGERVWPYECDSCGFVGKEHHTLEFSHHSDQEGNTVG